MNDLDLRLEVVSRSCQPLRDIRRWISRKPLEIEAWFQMTTNRKWHTDYQMVTWPMTSRDRRRCCETVRSAILTTAWLLVYLYFHLSAVRSRLDRLSFFSIYVKSSYCVASRHTKIIWQKRTCTVYGSASCCKNDDERQWRNPPHSKPRNTR